MPYAIDRLRQAGGVIGAKGLALVVAEVEFGEIAMEVLRRHVMGVYAQTVEIGVATRTVRPCAEP
jgi:hypothetical protein